MRGFAHFLTPGAKASIVDEGPWHYGVDYVSVYFRAELDGLRELLPGPLEPADGTSVAYVSEFVSVSEKNPEAAYANPSQTIYREAAIGTSCSYEGRPGIYFIFMWVDRDWSLIRGWLNGYPKKLADEISMTKLHPLNPLAGPLGIGSKLSGYCARQGERLLAVRLKITRRGGKEDLLPFGSTYGLRHFPSTDPTQTMVSELVEVSRYDWRVGEVWVGDGEIELGRAINEELDIIRPRQILHGISYQAGFTIGGAKVLKKLS